MYCGIVAEEVLCQSILCSGYFLRSALAIGDGSPVVCWVIKLLVCSRLFRLLCSAPGLKCAVQLCASDHRVEHKKGVLDSVANGGERRVYCPRYH